MMEKRKVQVISPKEGGQLLARKFGRNEPCYCGSGKKVKNCCKVTTKYFTQRKVKENGSKSV